MAKPPVQETAQEARQGPRGRPVLYVLIVGLLLAILAWGVAELYGEKADNKTGVNEEQTNSQAAPPAPSANGPVNSSPANKNPAPQTGTGGASQMNSPN
jgi:hypothetical protein